MEKNLFELASRSKYRFVSSVGYINAEDLWDLSLENLNDVYQRLESQLTETNKKSLLSSTSKADDELSNKIEIVKYVFETLQSEKLARLNDKERAEKKQYLLSVLADKEKSETQSKSAEELKAMIAEL